MTDFPKVLMVLGAVLLIAGAVWHFVGRLPGDIFVKKGNVTFFFPRCHLYCDQCDTIHSA